ncbi:methyltransferase family protein [Chloroflexota bacterium]
MSYILVGLLSFVLMAGADWATYKKVRFLKPLLWFAVIPTAAYALVMAWLNSARFTFPDILSLIAWFPLLLFFGLFVYSAFIEIPLKTYIATSQPIKVVTNGTYSLSRHPAALWFAGWLVSAIIVSQSVTLAVAAPFWIAAYVGCIFWEDMLTSIGDFGEEYRKYQGTTPMIIPTRRSIARFWRNMRSRFYRT